MTVRAALELNRTRAENRALHAELARRSALVGESAAMRQVRALIERVAPTEARVLITGESGTGKELVAAAIHGASRRSDRAFVTVNCAAIPRDLVESEMFGHERGAFTGATERRLGRFELAHGGTLFLDEVGDLSAEAQAKLLRTLETGELQRIGAESDAAGGRAGRRGDQSPAGGCGGRRRLPGGPLLPPQRLPDPASAAARAAGGLCPRSWRTWPSACGRARRRCSRPRRSRRWRRTAGPATCASSPTWSSASASSAGPRSTRARCARCCVAAAPPPPAPAALGRPLSEALDDYERGLIARRADAGGGQRRRGGAAAADRPRQPVPPHAAAGSGPGVARPRHHFDTRAPHATPRRWPAVLLATAAAAPGPGQRDRHRPRLRRRATPIVRAGPPPDVVSELIAFYNDTATTRVQGDVSFPAGSRFDGRLAVFRGALRIAGRVRGESSVANGTLYLLPGADVDGDILVVGGRLIRSPGARHAGRERVLLGCRAGAAQPRRRARAARAAAPARRARHARAPASRPAASAPTLAARHRRDLQPDRGAADRLRPDLRAPALPAGARAAGPARHPPHRGRGLPAAQRLRLQRPGRAARSRRAASPDGSTARSTRSRSSRSRPARTAGRPSCCSGTTATTSSGAASAARSGSSPPGRSASSSPSGGTTRAACGPPIPGRCSGTATAGVATR